MKDIFYPLHWLPFIWVLLQTYMYLTLTLLILRRSKLLMTPVAGMEYGDVAVACSLLLGTLLIPTGDISQIFQSAKILQNSGGPVMQNTIMQFAQYFIIGLLGLGIFLMAGSTNHRLLFKSKKDNSENDDNLVAGILVAFINIGIAIALWFWFKELADRITPEFINFR